jgi:hypothetical protein
MKTWIVVIGIDKFYLTEKEKEYYLQAISSGAKFVDLGDKILGSNFQYMAQNAAIEETKMLDEGRWFCSKGKWHQKGWDCTCENITLPTRK